MKREMIIRAWKDPEFRASLTAEQRAALPDNPSGKPMTELDEAELGDIVGGRTLAEVPSTGCVDFVRPTCGFVLCPITQTEM
jgi:mersacidin/lichenicidin family type 2 lantibiotic